MKTAYLIILKDYDFSEYQQISIASQLPAARYCDVTIVSSIRFESCERENLQKLLTLSEETNENRLSFTYFDDHYFHSLDGYNELLKSKIFYQQFDDYEYMIVSQADVYLLQPQMLMQIDTAMQTCDYLGAPWFFYVQDTPSLIHLSVWSRKYFRSIRKIKEGVVGFPKWLLFKLRAIKRPLYINHTHLAGNGGFSIRKVSSFLKYFTLVENGEIINATTLEAGADTTIERNVYAEDIFWGLLVPRTYKSFRVARPADAIFICWESGQLKTLLKLTRGKYPWAIHAWWKWSLKDFILSHSRNFQTVAL